MFDAEHLPAGNIFRVIPHLGRGGSRAGGLGGAPQLTWRHTRSTIPFLKRMHARARTHTHAQFWSTRMPIPNLHFGQFDKNDSVGPTCYPNAITRNVHWFHSGHNLYAFAKKRLHFTQQIGDERNRKCSVEVLLRRSGWGVRAV